MSFRSSSSRGCTSLACGAAAREIAPRAHGAEISLGKWQNPAPRNRIRPRKTAAGGTVLSVYVADGGRLQKTLCSAPESMPADPVWLDMLAPTAEEDGLVEQKLGISVPTRDEMQEIEPSSRLYTENGTCYMTATLLSHAESEHPHSSAVTFILVGKRLVTVRYVEPKSFELFIARVQRPGANALAGDAVLIGLLETVIDRAADILERLAG